MRRDMRHRRTAAISAWSAWGLALGIAAACGTEEAGPSGAANVGDVGSADSPDAALLDLAGDGAADGQLLDTTADVDLDVAGDATAAVGDAIALADAASPGWTSSR